MESYGKGISQIFPLGPDQLKAGMDALPTDPHSMTFHMWRLDYSSIARQLQRLPPLADAELRFGEYMLDYDPLSNVGRVNNPTKQMVMDIYILNQKILKEQVPEVLRVSLKSLEWDYRPEVTIYIWDPDKNIFLPRDPNRLHPAYPQEVGLDKVISDLRESYEKSQRGNTYTISAARLTLGDTPNSKVVMASDIFSVEYWGKIPNYLPSLEAALEGTHSLRVKGHY